MSLFHVHVSKSVRLEEFEQLQVGGRAWLPLAAHLRAGRVCVALVTHENSGREVKLYAFSLKQVAACDATANHLRDNWSVAVKNIIKV